MSALDLVESIARRRGFKVERRNGRLYVKHAEAPLTVTVEESEGTVTISLTAEGVRDFIEDVYESEEDPRGYIEGLLDDVTALVTELTTTLERKGFKVRVLRVRDVVMDVLEMLEEVEES